MKHAPRFFFRNLVVALQGVIRLSNTEVRNEDALSAVDCKFESFSCDQRLILRKTTEEANHHRGIKTDHLPCFVQCSSRCRPSHETYSRQMSELLQTMTNHDQELAVPKWFHRPPRGLRGEDGLLDQHQGLRIDPTEE